MAFGDMLGTLIYGPVNWSRHKREQEQEKKKQKFLDYVTGQGGFGATVPVEKEVTVPGRTIPAQRVGTTLDSLFGDIGFDVPAMQTSERTKKIVQQMPLTETPEYQRRAMGIMGPDALEEAIAGTVFKSPQKPSYSYQKGNRNILSFRDGQMVGKTPLEQPFEKETPPKAPTTRTFTEGGRTVEKQWNPETGKWEELSSGPRWQPEKKRRETPTTTQAIRRITDLEKMKAQLLAGKGLDPVSMVLASQKNPDGTPVYPELAEAIKSGDASAAIEAADREIAWNSTFIPEQYRRPEKPADERKSGKSSSAASGGYQPGDYKKYMR